MDLKTALTAGATLHNSSKTRNAYDAYKVALGKLLELENQNAEAHKEMELMNRSIDELLHDSSFGIQEKYGNTVKVLDSYISPRRPLFTKKYKNDKTPETKHHTCLTMVNSGDFFGTAAYMIGPNTPYNVGELVTPFDATMNVNLCVLYHIVEFQIVRPDKTVHCVYSFPILKKDLGGKISCLVNVNKPDVSSALPYVCMWDEADCVFDDSLVKNVCKEDMRIMMEDLRKTHRIFAVLPEETEQMLGVAYLIEKPKEFKISDATYNKYVKPSTTNLSDVCADDILMLSRILFHWVMTIQKTYRAEYMLPLHHSGVRAGSLPLEEYKLCEPVTYLPLLSDTQTRDFANEVALYQFGNAFEIVAKYIAECEDDMVEGMELSGGTTKKKVQKDNTDKYKVVPVAIDSEVTVGAEYKRKRSRPAADYIEPKICVHCGTLADTYEYCGNCSSVLCLHHGVDSSKGFRCQSCYRRGL